MKHLRKFVKINSYTYKDIGILHYIIGDRKITTYDRVSREKRAEAFVKRIRQHTLIKSKKFLDVGAGYGSDVLAISSVGASISIGVDLEIYPESIVEFRENQFNAKILKGVGELLPFKDNIFDIATTNAIEHFLNPVKALDELIRVVKPRGRIYLEIGGFWDTPTASHFYNHLNIPWSHFLFDNELLISYVRNNSFAFEGYNAKEYADIVIEQFKTLNRLFTEDYKKMLFDARNTHIVFYQECPISFLDIEFYKIFKSKLKYYIAQCPKLQVMWICLEKIEQDSSS